MSVLQHQTTFTMNDKRLMIAITVLGTLLAANGVYLNEVWTAKTALSQYDLLLFALQLCGMFCVFPALCLCSAVPDAENQDGSKKI